MSNRPKKIIGWGIEVLGSDLSEDVSQNFSNTPSLYYSDFFKYLDAHYDGYDSMSDSLGYTVSRFKDMLIAAEQSVKISLTDFIQIIPEDEFSEKDVKDQKFFITFTDKMMEHPDIALKVLEDSKQADENFLYQEMTALNPEAFKDNTNFVKFSKFAPVYSEYSIVDKLASTIFTANDDSPLFGNYTNLTWAVNFVKSQFKLDYYRVLYNSMPEYIELQDLKYAEAHLTDSDLPTIEDVSNRFSLCAPQQVLFLALFSGVLKDFRKVKELKPMVTYYWA